MEVKTVILHCTIFHCNQFWTSLPPVKCSHFTFHFFNTHILFLTYSYNGTYNSLRWRGHFVIQLWVLYIIKPNFRTNKKHKIKYTLNLNTTHTFCRHTDKALLFCLLTIFFKVSCYISHLLRSVWRDKTQFGVKMIVMISEKQFLGLRKLSWSQPAPLEEWTSGHGQGIWSIDVGNHSATDNILLTQHFFMRQNRM